MEQKIDFCIPCKYLHVKYSKIVARYSDIVLEGVKSIVKNGRPGNFLMNTYVFISIYIYL